LLDFKIASILSTKKVEMSVSLDELHTSETRLVVTFYLGFYIFIYVYDLGLNIAKCLVINSRFT